MQNVAVQLHSIYRSDRILYIMYSFPYLTNKGINNTNKEVITAFRLPLTSERGIYKLTLQR